MLKVMHDDGSVRYNAGNSTIHNGNATQRGISSMQEEWKVWQVDKHFLATWLYYLSFNLKNDTSNLTPLKKHIISQINHTALRRAYDFKRNQFHAKVWQMDTLSCHLAAVPFNLKPTEYSNPKQHEHHGYYSIPPVNLATSSIASSHQERLLPTVL